MPPTLRPMKLGEILDQGFSLYRRNLWKLAGTTVLPALIMISLHVADLAWIHLDRRIGHPADKMDAFGIGFLVWLIYSQLATFVRPFFYPATVKVTTGILFEEPVSVTEALRFNAKRWHRYFWIGLLKNAAQTLFPGALGFGMIIGLYFADETLHFGLNVDAMGWICILIILAMVAVSFWIGARVAFAIPAAAVEGIGGFKALRRSWRLSKGARFQVFLTWSIIFVLTMILGYAAEFAIRGIEWFMRSMLHLHFVNGTFDLVAIYIFAAFYNSIAGPIYPVLLVLLYLNQRVLKEGYDIERMIEVAGLTVPVAIAAGEESPVPAAAEVGVSPVEGPSRQPAGESLE